MESTNHGAQVEEVEALKAIYGEDFRICSRCSNSYSISINTSNSSGVEQSIDFKQVNQNSPQVTYPDDYPSLSPPIYELRCTDWLACSELQHIEENLKKLFKENQGDVVVYQWVEWIRDFINTRASEDDSVASAVTEDDQESLPEEEMMGVSDVYTCSHSSATSTSCEEKVALCPDIFHGEPLIDRKSTFQAHVAAVESKKEVEAVMAELKANRKIAAATHNILAYRLHDTSRGVFMQDCDDDGESGAGGRLLHLLQMMDIRNGMVVVSRWFGGILLHADRFKHINNVARTLLQQSGIVKKHKNIKSGKSSGKRTK